MYKELNRLATFSDWQESVNVSPLQLARNGFYYSRNSGETICFSCDLRIDRWSVQDSPWEYHRHLSPNCPIVAGTETRNIPLIPSTSTWTPPHGVSDRLITASSGSIDNVLRSALNRAKANRLFSRDSTYRIDRSSPDFVQLRQETVRLGTFDDWPSTAYASPWALAREGFFYMGVEDRVQCVFCRGCLKRWQPNDCPSLEHSKHYPACPFVLGLDVGNVPASGSSAETRTMTLPAGNHSLLTRAEGFTLQTNEQSQMTRQVQTSRTLDQGLSGPDQQGNEVIDLEARLNVPAVRAVLDMGFSLDLVKRTIENKLSATGTDFPNAESLLDAVFSAGDALNFHNDRPASATDTAVAAVSSSSVSFTATSVASESVIASNTRAANAVTGFTSLLSTHSSRDSGIFSPSSSTTSLPAVSSKFQLPLANSSSPVSPPLAAVQSEAHALAPMKPNAFSASVATAIAAIPEVDTSSKAKLKAKRRRNKKKTPASAVSSNKDVEQDPMTNGNVDETAAEEEAGKEAEAKTDTNPDDEAQKYLEENRQLREARTCKVCMDAEVNTVFLPCGHLVCCNTCSPLLRNCPICRTFIRGTVKTSLSQ